MPVITVDAGDGAYRAGDTADQHLSDLLTCEHCGQGGTERGESTCAGTQPLSFLERSLRYN